MHTHCRKKQPPPRRPAGGGAAVVERLLRAADRRRERLAVGETVSFDCTLLFLHQASQRGVGEGVSAK